MDTVEAVNFTRSRRMKYIAAVLLALVLVLAAIAFWWWNRPVEAPATAQPGSIIAITATELAAAYDEDPVGTNIRFANNLLRVTGTLTNFAAGLGADPVITLGGSNPGLSVTAAFDTADTARLAAVPGGSRVTVTCQSVSLVAETPALDDCTLER